jgi:hypothetical protein
VLLKYSPLALMLRSLGGQWSVVHARDRQRVRQLTALLVLSAACVLSIATTPT